MMKMDRKLAAMVAIALLALVATPAMAYFVCDEPCKVSDSEIAVGREKAKEMVGYFTEMPLTEEETLALGCDGCSGVRGSVKGYGGIDASYIIVSVPIGDGLG